MKKPSSILRTLSSLRPASSARRPASLATVAPLPEQSPFDQQMTVYLSNLNQQKWHTMSSHTTDNSTSWLLDFFEASITAQKLAQDSLDVLGVNRNESGREAIDAYLEENVQLLDSCNMLLEKMEMIRKYIDSLRVAVHLLDQGGSLNRASRVQRLLDTRTLESCTKTASPSMKKSVMVRSNVSEALSGSTALASIVCHLLELGLSTKSKKNSSSLRMKSRPTKAWLTTLLQLQNSAVGAEMKHRGCNSMMMPELRQMMVEVRLLGCQVAKAGNQKEGMMGNDVEGLRRSCDELEQVVLEPFERRVKELYRELISIRMALL